MGRREILIELASLAEAATRGPKSAYHPTPKAYQRAATQRLEAARRLLEARHLLDAVYLGGYVVECSLKWLILLNTPRAKWRDAYEEISDPRVAGHDYTKLLGILRRKGVVVSDRVASQVEYARQRWHTGLRYEGKLVPIGEARAFLDHVESVVTWAEEAS